MIISYFSCIILVDKDNMQIRDSLYIWVLIVIDKMYVYV